MRHIIYECDWCKRQYPYHLKVEDNDRGILLRVPELKIEICYTCSKKLKQECQKYVS